MENAGHFFIKKSYKVPLTYYQQFLKFKSRRLNGCKRDVTIEYLKKNNYYRLTGYTKLFSNKKDKFDTNFSFQKLKSIYNFDQELRNILMFYVEKIEITFKTQVAYVLANQYGTFCYFNYDIFKNKNLYFDQFSTIKSCIKQSNYEVFIKKHNNELLPIWILVEIFTFDKILCFYDSLNNRTKKLIISKSIYKNIKNFKTEDLSKFMKICKILRNSCAHYSRLYHKKIPYGTYISKNEKAALSRYKVKFPKTSNVYVFWYIFIMCKFLSIQEAVNLISKIDVLFLKYQKNIKISDLGFPKKWKEMLTYCVKKLFFVKH